MLRLELDGGGSAIVVRSEGELVELDANRAFPPGATLVGSASDVPGSFQVKVRGSKRLSGEVEACFRVTGRWVNLTRAQRERLGSVT